MGVECAHFLMPRDNTVRPTPERISALIEAWQEAGFILRPGSAALDQVATCRAEAGLTGAWQIITGRPRRKGKPFSVPVNSEDLAVLAEPVVRIQWPIQHHEQAGTEYPLYPVPEDAYYDLEIRQCDDFIEECCDNFRDVLNTTCACGTDLSYWAPDEEPLWPHRIRRVCASCGRAFRPQEQMLKVGGGVTADVSMVAGGMCYRFAIVVDCGKCWKGETMPDANGVRKLHDPIAADTFLTVSSSALGIELYGVNMFY